MKSKHLNLLTSKFEEKKLKNKINGPEIIAYRIVVPVWSVYCLFTNKSVNFVGLL